MAEYCTIDDVRAEGVTEAAASDTRVAALIRAASALIDRVTGWWFDARELTLKLDGSGTQFLHLPAPAVEVTEVRRVWRASDPDTTAVIEADAYVVYSYDLPEHRWNPKLVLLTGTVHNPIGIGIPGAYTTRWIKGAQPYEIDGTFGFLEEGEAGYGTPEEIRRACIDLVMHRAPTMSAQCGVADPARDRRTGDLKSLTVQGRSQTWGGPSSAGLATGLRAVDDTLALYRRPIAVEPL